MKMFEKTSYSTAFHELVFIYFYCEEGWQLILEQQPQFLDQDGEPLHGPYEAVKY